MILHYFKIAIRNLGRQKGLTFINIFGLSLGIACFSLFVLYALNEFSYDRFHTKKDSIYRVFRYMQDESGKLSASSYMPIPLGPAMKQDLPGVKNYVRFKNSWKGSYVRIDDKVSSVPLTFADPQVFSVFSFPFIYGNPESALQNEHSVVLTEKTAKQLFATENPVGKSLEIKVENNFETYLVSGVCKNIPSNSTVQFQILGSFDHYLNQPSIKKTENNWDRSGYQTYLELQPGSTLPSNITALKSFYHHRHADANPNSYYSLLKMEAIHTDMDHGGDRADPKNVFILIAISSGILLIACINFTTLSIGRSAGRAREIGVRKVIGSTKTKLVVQFLTEALVLSVLSAAAGLVLTDLLMPFFNTLAGKELTFSFRQFPELKWFLLGITLMVGLVAGSYPALVLSSFKPVEALKRKLKLSGSNVFTRSLVTFQFVVSVSLIIATIVIIRQVNYMRDRNPGFNKENVMVVDAEDANPQKVYPLFRQLLLSHPSIKGIAGAEMSLGEGMGWSQTSFGYKGKQKQVFEYAVDPNYANVMGLTLLAGRNFDPKIASDTINSVVINEAMMKDFGWTLQNAVGQSIADYSDKLKPTVIGVVKNFNYLPMNDAIEPQMFQSFHGCRPFKYLVRMEAGSAREAISAAEEVWKQLVPEIPFKYSFLDEDLDRFYKSEARWGSIIGWAGGISIFLACLGLLGLASLAAVNRIKEIGIRKILGASALSITQLLSKDFVKLVAVAIVIASPLAWYVMNKWLQDFAYRIEIGWSVFVMAGSFSVVLAVTTISFQSVKAAAANPVKNLRSE